MNKKMKYVIFSVVGLIGVTIILFYYWKSQPYYKKYSYVAHALGGVEGQDYTNSKEALYYSYKMGIRLMEVDLAFTSDQRLVCRHKWKDDMEDGISTKDIPTYKTFMDSKIYGSYTPLAIEDIISFAMENPDTYFITDIKEYENNMYQMLQIIEETSKRMGYTEFERQFVIQIYDYDNYEQISQNFTFQNYILTLYRMKEELKENGVDNILEFCLNNNIKVVTLPVDYATKEISQKLEENDISLYAHTINSRKKMVALRLKGVDGIYTDYIYPVKLFQLVGTLAVFGVGVSGIFIYIFYKIKVRRRQNKK